VKLRYFFIVEKGKQTLVNLAPRSDNPKLVEVSDSPDQLVLLAGIDSIIRTVNENVEVMLDLDVNANEKCMRIEKTPDCFYSCVRVFKKNIYIFMNEKKN